MSEIKAKIYYEILNGNILTITSECEGTVEETTKEQDMEIYPQLKGKNIDDVAFIELSYGTLISTFTNVKSSSVNLETKTLDTVYYTQAELDAQTQEQLAEKTISDRISTISEYATLDNNSIADLENAIIEYETNLIMNGVV